MTLIGHSKRCDELDRTLGARSLWHAALLLVRRLHLLGERSLLKDVDQLEGNVFWYPSEEQGRGLSRMGGLVA